MSQHQFTHHPNGLDVIVLMGWDRPQKGFFMDISQTNHEGNTELLYSATEQSGDINVFSAELAERQIIVPEQMISEVITDGVRNIGNKIVHHRYEGNKHIRKQLQF